MASGGAQAPLRGVTRASLRWVWGFRGVTNGHLEPSGKAAGTHQPGRSVSLGAGPASAWLTRAALTGSGAPGPENPGSGEQLATPPDLHRGSRPREEG